MLNIISRRDFLMRGAMAGAGAVLASSRLFGGAAESPHKNIVDPSRRLRVATIGTGGQGSTDARMMAPMVDFTAFADVDSARAGGMFEKYPNVPRYKDYRKMLDEQGDNIDAVIVATPDHMHYPAAVLAMSMGKHVYVEKPATHTIGEARALKALAKKTGLVTQMGNHGHAYDGWRKMKEWIDDGWIGDVREVHIWTNRPVWPQGVPEPDMSAKVTPPPNIDWNLWLGVSPVVPYNKDYAPFNWRGMWEWGTGAIGDMACHMMDPIFSCVDLRGDVRVSSESFGSNSFSCPLGARIKYSFAKSATRPQPIDFYWYEGKRRPQAGELPEEYFKRNEDIPRTGMLYVGTKGAILDTDDYGMRAHLLPRERMKDLAKNPPAQRIARVPDQNARLEFVRACQGGPTPGSNFAEHSMDLTELALLGSLSLRLGGAEFAWDVQKGACSGLPEADRFINKSYRKF